MPQARKKKAKKKKSVSSKKPSKKNYALKFKELADTAGFVVGGQAVIEGVMMRTKTNMAVAVRKPDKSISVRRTKINAWPRKFSFLNWPFIRGVYSLFETMVTGIEALTYSANESLDEEEEKLSTKELVITIAISLLFSIGIFVVLPFAISHWLTQDTLSFNILDGVLRLLFFFLYIVIIARMDDIKTIFQYHGAEHKSVHVFEHKKGLMVKNARPFTRLHPRCGTSFLFLVLALSIVIFSFITHDAWVVKLAGRLLLLPVIAGTSYEVLRLSAKYQEHPVMKVIIQPGLWFQKITTAEPDDGQLEVALKALQGVLEMEVEESA